MSLSRSLSLVLLAVACGAPATPVTIGIVLDGDGIHGAQAAAEDINAGGGIGGRPLALRVMRGESGNVAKVSLRAADSLAADPSVLAVVGHTNSAASLAGAQVYNSRHLVQIAPTSTAPVFSEAGPYSFRLVAGDQHQGSFLARTAVEQGSRRPAIVYVNDDYGRAIRQTVVAGLATRGVMPAYEAAYLEARLFTDVDVMVRSIAAGQPDLLIWLGREPELRVLLPRLRRVRPDIGVLASDGFSAARLTEPGGESLIGVRYVRLRNPDLDSPTLRRVLEKARGGRAAEVTDQAVLSYEAVRVLAQAIAEAGADREKIRRYLSEVGSSRPAVQGLGRSIAFDANGDGPPAYFLVEVTARGSRQTSAAP